MSEKKKVLMICLGNICRSPIAEAVFDDYIKKNGLSDKWEVESAALIGYHTGKSPDNRAITTLKEKGISDYSHAARPITKEDFKKFDWIFGMDEDNIDELKRKSPKDGTAKIELLGKYDPEGDIIIRDPYYDSGREGFVKAFEQCKRSVAAFLKENK
ncbi:low molecular weight phosphotyrosine protein phosphatase 1-like [Belonocnema kinseyi]|uniref:low molecular weight phosphotyrosine protein phosphatase 1-like n=1 Tax=Belonocnema kinseyi TaxID=2817044 RepID=UPI00143DDF33|nr:low molecular weight phosphotyrosine protein phosphatase 1-like [Belonocnema kinseyi]XP_033207335.1 low molecular weight phosphotyrosine protein phosphatase 1-like [Belonocnema kinseyi]XP_033207336.1 low molecular weight phosphotyrosine protein phosphatase 1-like [Belonocnema kinseyi]XP_033207337.1 low molecular weight phosphotyrosine protein phosphatase 1-like [Belonocnema kinseyi]